MPKSFNVPRAKFSDLYPDAPKEASLEKELVELGRYNDTHIDENEKARKTA